MIHSSPKKGTFILGLGMAKAGTTWLFDFLDGHPQVRMGFEKEMHILHAPEYGSYVRSFWHIPWRKFGGRFWVKEQAIRAWYRTDWNRYFDYFASRLESDAKLTGDLSPSNQTMSIESMVRVREEFRKREIRVLSVFIARDPVDRLLSDVRYSQRILERSRYRTPSTKGDKELFLDSLKLGANSLAGAPETARRMNTAFNEQDRMILLHEELFQQETIDRLTDSAGISRKEASVSRKVNAAPERAVLPEGARRAAAGLLASTYEWAAGQFGRSRILALWPNAKFVLADDAAHPPRDWRHA